ncbi:MAG: hypothetical protein Q9O74_00240 [Planctomycetota bacterium]|nr:hypothetical protein [Planctomycetota bacterium]
MKSMLFRSRMPLCGTAVLLLVGAATILAAPVSAAQAQSVDRETVEAWLRAEWANAADAQLPPDIVLEYVVDVVEVPTAAEIRALRAEVRNRPDHPMRQDLEIYERRLAHGPDRTVHKVWYSSEDQWRLSQSLEYTGDEGGYWDTARSGALVWGMSKQQLTLVDAEHEAEVKRRFAERGTEVIRSVWNSLVFGNFAFGWFQESTPTLISIQNDVWIAQAVNSGGVIGEWRGRWDSAAGRGFVTSVAFIGKTNGEPSSASEWYFEDWSYNRDVGVWIAARAAKQLDHRPMKSTRYLGAERVSDEVVRRAISIPDIAGEDPVRGVVTISKVSDLRTGRDEVQWLDESQNLLYAETSSAKPRASNTLRWIGWATLVVMVGALLWVRVGRSSVGR